MLLAEPVEEFTRVGVDVVVLDCVQFAAGLVGQFGSGASSLLHSLSFIPVIIVH